MAPSTHKWCVVGMLWLICLFNYADRQSIASVFPLLEAEFHLTPIQLGLVISSFMWVYAGIGWMAGMTGDRFPRKTVILAGLIFWSLITLLLGYSSHFWHLVGLRALQGLGEAFYFPAAMSLLSDYHGKETRSRAMAVHQSAVYAGTVAGGSLAGWMGQNWGWRSSFYLLGSLGILLGIVLVWALREPRRGQAEGAFLMETAPPPSFGSILSGAVEVYRSPMVWILTLVFIGANFVAVIFLSWLPKFLFDKFGLTLTMAGFSATFYLQVGSVTGVLAGGVLADWWVARKKGGRMLSQSLGLFLGVPFLFLVGWTLSMPALVLAMALFGLSKGIYDANIWASLHDVVRPEQRSTAVGLMNSLAWLGGGLGALSAAAAAGYFEMSACLSATSLVYLGMGLLLVWGVRKYLAA